LGGIPYFLYSSNYQIPKNSEKIFEEEAEK
jgi:hypothetical protein